jgi:hypothetical protein
MAGKAQTEQKNTEAKIPIFLPLLPDEGGSVEVDQRVNVEINGKTTIIMRGEHCEVTMPVYEALYNSGRFGRM